MSEFLMTATQCMKLMQKSFKYIFKLISFDFYYSLQHLSYFVANVDRILEQQKKNQWNSFVEPREIILKYGFVNKKKGLFARKRMLLLTNTPRLIYIDAEKNQIKGEIPFTKNLSCEAKTFKIFFIHTVRDCTLKMRKKIHSRNISAKSNLLFRRHRLRKLKLV